MMVEDQRKILFVANVAKEHIMKFHIPTIRRFKAQGWIVDVACSGVEDIPYCDRQYKMCWERSPFTLKTIRGVQDLQRIIETNYYDIVYCHTPVGGLIGRLAARKARKLGTKVIYCAHGLHFFKGAPKFNWLVYYPIEKFLSLLTDYIFVVNKEDYTLLSEKFRTKICFVPEVGVNFERLITDDREKLRRRYRDELRISDSTTAMIYVAEIIPNKNQRMLIDVTKELISRGKDVCLILPGPEHDGGATKQYANDNGIKDKVLFLGWRDDVGGLMYAADICVASSIREGFGINLVEAMYCGLPVIATKNRGHEMIIEDGVNGFLVEVGDNNAMADKVTLLMENSSLLKSNDVGKYDCEKIAGELYDVLISCL